MRWCLRSFRDSDWRASRSQDKLWLASGAASEFGEEAPDSVPYELVPYEVLETLPHEDGRTESIFNEHGIVKGSERVERFILFSMGIPSVGSMRQRGTTPLSSLDGRTSMIPISSIRISSSNRMSKGLLVFLFLILLMSSAYSSEPSESTPIFGVVQKMESAVKRWKIIPAR